MNSSILIHLLILVVLIILLVKSASLTEHALISVAKKLKISEFIMGFVVLGIVTSLPEISIAVFSSQDVPELSLGNLLGATTVLLTLVIGSAAIKFKSLIFRGRFQETDVLGGIVILMLMLISIIDKTLTFTEGSLLVGLYVGYIIFLNRNLHIRSLKHYAHKKLVFTGREMVVLLFQSLAGLTILIFSAYFLIETTSKLAVELRIPESFIGAFLLAVGTNLPELTLLILAKSKEDGKLVIGNFFGSACVNVGIMGGLGILSNGFRIGSSEFQALIPSMIILFWTLISFGYFSWTGKRLVRKEGMVLIGLYFILIFSELLLTTLR